MNIYLIGMPGCGKSSVGIKLSSVLNFKYIDLDEYIENSVGMKIPAIFEKYGEEKFREYERIALEEIRMMDNTIISCGGGIIVSLKNKELMNGKCVYIKVSIDDLKTRILNDKKNIRPLFKTKTVEELYEERRDKYNYFKDIEVINDEIDLCVSRIIK
ncbi:MAG: shikimate kinase, partial [Anaeroplasmataceae bacterium]